MDSFLNKYNEIKNSWKNLIWKNQEVEKLAEKRASICADCPINTANICMDCGCFIPAKIRGEDNSCPKNKW